MKISKYCLNKNYISITEWRHGRGGHLTLADEDLTTKTVNGGWRKLNTLRHYGVKDSAVMSLVNKQNESFSSNCKLHTIF